MLRDLWNRLIGRERARAVEHEAEREKMSPDERRFTKESVDDIQADAFVSEHLGGTDPERLVEDDEPPRH
jgi:hypothetical protein